MKATTKLTRFELEVMQVLWNLGTASIKELRSGLPKQTRPAYTTIQTIVNRLEKKGAVRRVGKVGQAHIFEPLLKRRAAHRRLVDELLRLFGGSTRPLMAHLAESGRLSLDDLREAEDLLTQLGNNAEPVAESRPEAFKRAGILRRRNSASRK